MSISRPTGNGTPADEAAVRQLQADVLRMSGDIADIKQTLVLLPAMLDKLAHVIDQGDRLIALTAGPDGVPAWQATLGALGGVAARLETIEAGLGGLAKWATALDGRVARVAVQAQQTRGMTIVALAAILASKASRLISWWRQL